MLDTPIIISDEEIQNGDWTIDLKTMRIAKMERDNHATPSSSTPVPFSGFKKVVADLDRIPIINWNNLEEEFGYIDIIKLSKNSTKNKTFANGLHEQLTAEIFFRKGFNACQQLNDKKFTLEVIKDAFKMGQNVATPFKLLIDDAVLELDDYIQSISQPKIFDIEIEMRYNGEYLAGKCGENEIWAECQPTPKIVNNSVKIIKKL